MSQRNWEKALANTHAHQETPKMSYDQRAIIFISIQVKNKLHRQQQQQQKLF